jgi:hypothetical protein
MNKPDREPTAAERHLVEWMLEHGEPDARDLLPQLLRARVTGWRCPCGCASINFSVGGHPKLSGGLRPVADFVFGDEDDLSGIFVYEQSGVLSGLEVYGMGGDAPKGLPTPDMLRPFSNATGTPDQ